MFFFVNAYSPPRIQVCRQFLRHLSMKMQQAAIFRFVFHTEKKSFLKGKDAA
jgi:hypothetical protein